MAEQEGFEPSHQFPVYALAGAPLQPLEYYSNALIFYTKSAFLSNNIDNLFTFLKIGQRFFALDTDKNYFFCISEPIRVKILLH